MKKAIAVLLIFILNSFVNAQSPTGKGAITVGGDISFSTQSFDQVSNNSTIFKFGPQLGYFFIDNFYSAISIDYNHQSMGSTKSDFLGIGPAFRYYFDLGKTKPFTGTSFTYYQQTSSGTDSKLTTTQFTLTGGISVFLTNSFALETSINYSFINYNFPSGYYLNNTDKSRLFQVAVGVNYFIY